MYLKQRRVIYIFINLTLSIIHIALEKTPEEIANQKVLQDFAVSIGTNIESEEDLIKMTDKLLQLKKTLEITSKIRKSRKYLKI